MFDRGWSAVYNCAQFFPLCDTTRIYVLAHPQRADIDAPEGSTMVAGLGAGGRRCVEVCMDRLVNQLARELTEAMSAAVADDARVEACREKARAAGLEMRVTLEAVVTFAAAEASSKGAGQRRLAARKPLEMSANDRRFLKSLRISADEAEEKEVE
jgi:hypothetical protein